MNAQTVLPRIGALALTLVVGACGIIPIRSAPYRSPWTLHSISKEEVVVAVDHGSECQLFDRVVMEEATEAVTITAFLADESKALCAGIGVTTYETLPLEAPIGDRRLIGCTYDPQGIEPIDIDCRDWP